MRPRSALWPVKAAAGPHTGRRFIAPRPSGNVKIAAAEAAAAVLQ